MTFDYGEPPSAPTYIQSDIRGYNGSHPPQPFQPHPRMEFLPGTRFPGGKIGPSGQMIPQPTGYSPSPTGFAAPPMDGSYLPSVPMTNPYSLPNQMPRLPEPGMDNGYGMMQNNMLPQMHQPYVHQRPPVDYNSMMYDYNGVDFNYVRAPPRTSYFMDEDLRERLLHQQLLSQLTIHDSGDEFRLPQEVNTYHLTDKGSIITNSYHELYPLKKEQKSSTLHPIVTSLFRANNRDGHQYCLKRVHACTNVSRSGQQTIDKWKSIRHANIIRLHEVFTTKAFQDNSLVLIYDFHPGADTAMDVFFRQSPQIKHKPLMKEHVIWSFIVQITSALRAIHSHGLAYRSLDLSKIILTGKNRIRLAGIAVKDLLSGASDNLQRMHQRDLTSLGHIVLSLTSNSIMNGHNHEQIGKVLDFVSKKYSKDLHSLITQLVFSGSGIHMNRRLRNINDLMPLIGARFYTMVDDALIRGDEVENQLNHTLENGRLFRLICKLGVADRGEYGHYETGDRYLLKLFRSYLFHQVSPNGTPFMDLFHVINCLNKLDSASPERFVMNNRDNENVLVVSYADIHQALQKCANEQLEQPS